MKKRKLVLFLIVIAGFFLVRCIDPAIEGWWDELPDKDSCDDYHDMVKDLPPEIVYIHSEIMMTLMAEPALVFNRFSIIEIESILFADGAVKFNGLPSRAGNPLSYAQMNNNNSHINNIAALVNGEEDLFVLIHGHAHPLLPPCEPGFYEELENCQNLSLARANSVAVQFMLKDDALGQQIRVAAYAGNRIITDSEHSDINRHVELIVVKLE